LEQRLVNLQKHPAKVLFSSREEFKALHNRENKSFFVIIALYVVILISLGAVRAASPFSLSTTLPVYFIAFVLIGWGQFSIGNGMHEAVHHNLRNRRSDRWASLLTAYPIGLTMSYRAVHLQHHRHLGTEKDPELALYTSFPRSRVEMVLRFLWFVSGIPALMQFFQQQSVGAKTSSYFEPMAFLTVQIVIAALFYLAFGNLVFYIFFWALPIATVGKLLSSTRLLCEHGSPKRDWVVRTISGPPLQTLVMGAFDFNYHGEHHLFPSVPYAGLKRLHELNFAYAKAHPDYAPFEGRLEFFEGGYLSLLARWFGELPLQV